MDGTVDARVWNLLCLKYFVMGFNIIFLMSGIVMVSIGTTIFGVYVFFNEFLETQYFSPATLLMITGGFIFLIAIIGFISVVKESTLLVNTYCILLCFICLLQLSAGISAMVMKDGVYRTAYEQINNSIRNYPHDNDAASAMDSAQTALACCGLTGPYDWKGVFADRNNSYMYNDIILPHSCCAELLTLNNHLECLRTYTIGCIRPLTRLIYQTIRIAFGTTLTLAIIQLAGISFAHRFGKLLIEIKSDRLARQIVIRKQRQNVHDAMGLQDRGYPYSDKPPSYEELTHTFK